MAKAEIGKEDLERRVLAAVRSKQGCGGTLAVAVERYDAPDGLHRTWGIKSVEPVILNQDASFRAFHAAADLQDRFDLVE